MRRLFYLFLSFLFISDLSYGLKNEDVKEKVSSVKLPFIKNEGQVNKEVKFYAKTFGGTLFVTKDGKLVYSLPKYKDKKLQGGVALREILKGAKIKEVKGLEKATAKVNYFIGKDPSKWRTNIETYNMVSLGEVYKGIELELRAYGKNVEKIFKVKPKSNPEVIVLKVEGAKELKIDKETGELIAKTELGDVRFTRPVAYQEVGGKRVNVEVRYKLLSKNSYRFEVGKYDKKKPLIIDPLLASTFLGGSGDDEAKAIALDTDSVYIAGTTLSTDYPTTTGSYDEDYNGGVTDAYISKLDKNLTTLLASTFIGGSDFDEANAIALDTDSVYIAGGTDSTDYPTITGSYDNSYNDFGDAYISKLDKDLTTLLASTFIGGSDLDRANAIALDSSSVYIAGYTRSTDYPTTTGSYDEDYNGGVTDAYISKLDKNLTTLLASTFIGGSDQDESYAIALDTDSVYIAGGTRSINYPTTTGSYDEDYNGSRDAYISKLNKNLTTLQASTLIGGSSYDRALAVAIDDDSVYIAGETWSTDYPTTIGSYDEDYNGSGDAYISKLNKNLTTLLASTFIGGSDFDQAKAIALDTDSVYIAGETWSTDYPTITGSYDEDYNGNADAYISKLDKNLSTLVQYTLTVVTTGDGTVTSNPVGIDCGTDCSESYDEGTVVILTATPDTGSIFAGWTGDCDSCGSSLVCSITMDSDKTCEAVFESLYTLTITKSGTGDGTVTSSPAGIDCGSTCSTDFINGTSVTLTVTVSGNNAFFGWSGDCSSCGNSMSCTINMNSDKICNAEFNRTTQNGRMFGNFTIGNWPNFAAVDTNITCNGSITPWFSLDYFDGSVYHVVVAYSPVSVICYDDPAFTPVYPSVLFDSTNARLTGMMDGYIPVKVEVILKDGGEPGYGRDYAEITIKNMSDTIVYQTEGYITSGSIYAMPLY